MSDELHSLDWQAGPRIQSWPGETFIFEHTDAYDVNKAVEMIYESPQSFRFGMVRISKFLSLVLAHGNLNEDRIANMSDEDKFRPVLFATEPSGAQRLIDGYHRTERCYRDGYEDVAAWILNREQTKLIWSPAPRDRRFY